MEDALFQVVVTEGCVDDPQHQHRTIICIEDLDIVHKNVDISSMSGAGVSIISNVNNCTFNRTINK